jgi:EAL domain-containing protein (putative c-di-GMP-specific phosphodiesterase class I)/CheY-like chemotaxis protein
MDITSWHCLVAESEPVQRELMVGMLHHMGAQQVTALADGPGVMRVLEDGLDALVDIMLMDLNLPGMDGLEVIRHMGEIGCKAGLIVLGSHGSDVMFSVETMAEAYGVNILGTVARPISASRLATLIDNYVPPPPQPVDTAPLEFTFGEVGRGLQADEFGPYFQPKIELETGQIKGLEMFARWRHPQHGVLGPGAFMHVLEQANRIDFLDWNMIEKSVTACRVLHDMGIPISFSVNVDQSTLQHPQFIAQIQACLERHHILADYITFEISERSVLKADPHFLERLLRLRMMGFGLAVDDYGTGRSNLQLLAAIPFSELKIDRSFVDGASRKRALSTVLKSYLGLARSLDRRSTAVGVETRQDWDFLQGLGCTYAQGFYIASPMPVEQVPDWLNEWRHFF